MPQVNPTTPATAANIYALFQQSRFAEGVALAESAGATRDEEILILAGMCAMSCEQRESAVAFFQRALAIKPNFPQALTNLGLVLRELGRYAEAENCYRQAVALQPEAPYPLMNLGELLVILNQYVEAEACFRRAMDCKPFLPAVALNLSALLLLQGRFIEGWRTYETRYHPELQNLGIIAPTHLPYPQWQGESLVGRSILLWPEQGYGDQIQFCRYAAVLKQLGAVRISLVCEAPLRSLLQTITVLDAVVSKEEAAVLPPHDYWSLLLSLPGYCGTTLENIPAELPYLQAAPERVEKWATRLPATGFRVGLVWKGAIQHRTDQSRSLPGLRFLAPLWRIPGVVFISLQKGQGEEEAIMPPLGQPMLALGGEIQDFADTAAIVAQLDLLISVDTSPVHLAGALQKPCWVLLPAKNDWRWLEKRSDSPWYPGVLRLFWKELDEDWSIVVNKVALALADLIGKSLSGRVFEYQNAVADFAALASAPTSRANKYKPDIVLEQVRVLYRQGRYQEVVELLAEYDSEQLNNAELLNMAGISAFFSQQTQQAEDYLLRAIATQPNYPDAHINLGNVYKELQREEEAEAFYRQALALQPNAAFGHNNIGELLRKQQRWQEAEDCFRQALVLMPGYAQAQQNLALLLREKNGPDHEETLNSDAGFAYCAGDLQRAELLWRRAISIKPDFSDALNKLGSLLQETNSLEEAEVFFRQAVACTPVNLAAQFNLGLLLMSFGKFAEGWPGYELRYHPEYSETDPATLLLNFPLWQGESLVGKSIVVSPEQGYGDQIHFCRFCKELKRLGAVKVTLVCEEALKSLFESLTHVDVLLSKEEVLESLGCHDYWVRIMSLPLYCGISLETLPAALPYLQAPAERLGKWSRRLPSGRLRVGLVWKGSIQHRNDLHRSLPSLRWLAPLWRIPGVVFISLQKGQGEEEAAMPPDDQPILALGGEIQDFADTAAIIAQLDLLISIDTSLVHLAGALNKPCWVLLPTKGKDWRWLHGRSDSPWYPGVLRLFTRQVDTDWSEVVNQVKLALADWAANTKSSAELNSLVRKRRGFLARFTGLFSRS